MKACRQCGTCCRKGGPALRQEDLALVHQGHIRRDQLLVIRQGELGYNPASNRVEPVPVELLKIRGQAGSWACLFLNQDATCATYAHRPTTCKILECWAPERLIASIYQETLQRRDLLAPGDTLLPLLDRHDQESPAPEWGVLLTEAATGSITQATIDRLTILVRADLAIRREATHAHGLTLEMEYFLFGRPLFLQLSGTGIICREQNGTMSLSPR